MEESKKQDSNIVNPYPQPTLDQIKQYLTEFGWNYTVVDNVEHPYIYAPIMLYNGKGTVITFHIEGDFVLVSSVDILRDVAKEYSGVLLEQNDTLKLVKIFATPNENEKEYINADFGFELCYESWNRDTFFVFLDFLCLGIDHVLQELEKKDIKFETKYINIVQRDE